MLRQIKEYYLSYLHPERSPCLQCDHLDMDKNCVKCQECDKRLVYLSVIDPEFTTRLARYSYSGGKTRYVNRKRITLDEEKRAENIIRDFAMLFCIVNDISFYTIMNTRTKKPEIVRERRRLIKRIKRRFGAPNKRISNAIGLKPATVSLALRG